MLEVTRAVLMYNHEVTCRGNHEVHLHTAAAQSKHGLAVDLPRMLTGPSVTRYAWRWHGLHTLYWRPYALV